MKVPPPQTCALPWRRLLRWAALSLAVATLIGLAGEWAARRELQTRTEALHQAVQVYTLGLRGMAEKYDYLPYAAAQYPDIKALLLHPDSARLQSRANRIFEELRGRTESAALYMIDAHGTALASSNWDTPDSFVGQSYLQRPYFELAMQGQRSAFYGVGMTTGRPGLFIAEPVQHLGRTIGTVVAKVGLEEVAATWSQAADPVLLRDARGIVFLSSVSNWLYRSSRQLGPQDLLWVAEHHQYGDAQTYPPLPWVVGHDPDRAEYRVSSVRDGRPLSWLALDAYLPELGWTLTVTTNLADVTQARRETLVLATLAAAVLLFGALYWQQRERRFTEQRQARLDLEQRVQERTQDLQKAHAFQQAMEDSLAVGMRARDLEGRIIYVNAALCDMLGYRADELLGCTQPYPYWYPDDLERHRRESEATLQGKILPQGFESRVRHRNGHEVITRVYTAPLIDSEGLQQGWMSSVVDITAQKRAEASQREQALQLQRSARLASLGEMASTLAHELNQPLMALSNFAMAARALAAQAPGPQGHGGSLLVSALDDIVAQSTRAGEIVKRIRGFIRPQSSHREPCVMAQMLEHALGLLQGELQNQQVRIDVALAPDLPAVRGDRVLLEQVLINLLQNAMQVVQELPCAKRVIEVRVRRMEQAVEVDVRDHGPGIAETLHEQVFAPFFSTKPDGLGLGLGICRTFIEAHGGHLRMSNHPEGGAVFSFTLPVQSNPSISNPPPCP
jgi:PAS domain S-box-containing protein